jgi:glycosyltransferase involved in cell wall biosynthesis
MTSSLQILIVYDCIFPGSVGGVERRNADLAVALADRGHRVTLAGWNPNGAERRHGDRVEVLPVGPPTSLYDATGHRRAWASVRFAFQCLRLDVRRFDVVETAHIPYLHLLPLALKCRLARRPLVVSWYEFWGPYWRRYVGRRRWRAYALVERVAARAGTFATASSRLTLDRLTPHRLRKPPGYLPCGIDLARIDAAIAHHGREMAEAGPPLLYVGRLVPEKRIDLLLEAVARLGPDARGAGRVLRIVGDGPDRLRLEGVVSELGIAGLVEFAGRLPSGDAVFAAMVEARIAVQPSSREGFGLFPLEAMAARLPVIYCTSPESAVAEIVRDGREGLAVEPTAEALTTAIVRLLRSEEERKRMAEAARRRAEEYSWAAVAARAEAILRIAVDL